MATVRGSTVGAARHRLPAGPSSADPFPDPPFQSAATSPSTPTAKPLAPTLPARTATRTAAKAVRYLTPCSDGTCTWDNSDPNDMPLSRWYPTVETLPTGDVIIIGGELFGSFVNTPQGVQNVPTYEFWPTRGAPVNSTFLMQTMPANLCTPSCSTCVYPWMKLTATNARRSADLAAPERAPFCPYLIPLSPTRGSAELTAQRELIT